MEEIGRRCSADELDQTIESSNQTIESSSQANSFRTVFKYFKNTASRKRGKMFPVARCAKIQTSCPNWRFLEGPSGPQDGS